MVKEVDEIPLEELEAAGEIWDRLAERRTGMNKIVITSSEQVGKKIYISVVGNYTVIPGVTTYEFEAVISVTKYENVGNEEVMCDSIEWTTESPGNSETADNEVRKFVIEAYQDKELP